MTGEVIMTEKMTGETILIDQISILVIGTNTWVMEEEKTENIIQKVGNELEQDKKWAAWWQNQRNDCAPSEHSDQPGHPPSLISLCCLHEESLGP